MRRALLRWLPLSLALHAAAVGGVTWLVREVAGRALFVDLTLTDPPADTRPAADPRPAAAARPAAARPASGSARVTARRAAADEAPASPAPAPARAEPETAPAPPAPSLMPAPVAPLEVPSTSGAPSVRAPDVPEPRAVAGGGTISGLLPTEGVSTASGGGADAPARGTSTEAGDGTGTGGGVARGASDGPLALAVPGDGGAGGYGPYLALVRRRVQESVTYPPAARRRGLTGTVHLDITLEPSGAIKTVALVRTSSHTLLDDAALEAVRGLGRVPFPPDVRPRALRVRLPVVFELK